MKKQLIAGILSIFSFTVYAQYSIIGQHSSSLGDTATLYAYRGFTSQIIDRCPLNAQGQFHLKYSNQDQGMGYISVGSASPFVLVLNKEDVVLTPTLTEQSNSFSVTAGESNLALQQYLQQQSLHKQVRSAWNYLAKIYSSNASLAQQSEVLKTIRQEENRLSQSAAIPLPSPPDNHYLQWYLPLKQTIEMVSGISADQPKERANVLSTLRQIDYSQQHLYRSGLLQEALESHFWLLQHTHAPLDSIYKDMKISIDQMMETLVLNEKQLNTVTNYLFHLLERHSLFEASEYLALKVLNESSCTLNDDLAFQLETYRALSIGNTAPDINFTGEGISRLNAPERAPDKLSAIKNPYRLVIFAASWCPQCRKEIPAAVALYPQLQKQGIEAVLVSLDANLQDFTAFAADLPFSSICDFKIWEGTAAKNYHIFSTPTMFLLDNKQNVVLRPQSVNYLKTWLDEKLK